MKKIAATLTALAAMSAPNITHAQDSAPPQNPTQGWENIFSASSLESIAGKPILMFSVPTTSSFGGFSFNGMDAQTRKQHIDNLTKSLKDAYPDAMQNVERRLKDFGSSTTEMVTHMLQTMPNNAGTVMRGFNTSNGFVTFDVCFMDVKPTAPTPANFAAQDDSTKARYLTQQILRVIECRNDIEIIKLDENISFRPDVTHKAIGVLKALKVPDVDIGAILLNRHFGYDVSKGAEFFASLLLYTETLKYTKPTADFYRYVGREYLKLRTEYMALKFDNNDPEAAKELLTKTMEGHNIRGAAAFVINWADNIVFTPASERLPPVLNWLDRYLTKAEFDCAMAGGTFAGKKTAICTPKAL